MEYIEPKPVEVDKKKKTRKRVIAGVTCGVLAAGLAVGAAFLISKVFIEYNNIELYSFKFDDSDPTTGATISAVKESATLPKKLRLPTKYKKHPIIGIEDSVFLERKEIEEIILPDSIQSIGVECFKGCENLAKINVPSSLESIGTNAFLRTAWYEAFPSGDIVTFGDFLYSFKGQMSAHSAVLGSHTSPKESYYSGNKVYLCDFSHYSQGVFKDQLNLEYAELPASMSGVPASFFEGCSALEDIDLPTSLVSIGSASFKDCTNLHINGFNSLENLASIGDYALANTKLSGDIVFNNNIYDVGEGVFSGCTSLNTVRVGESFRNIPNFFLEECSGVTNVILPDRELTTESRLSFIGERAFAGTQITSFTVPYNITTVRHGAFEECDNLTSVFAYQNNTGSKINRFDTETNQWVKSDSVNQGIQSIEKECFKESANFVTFGLVNENGVSVSNNNEVNFPSTLRYLGSINERSEVFTGTSVAIINFDGTQITTIAPNLCEDAVSLHTVNFGAYSYITKFNTEAFKGCVALTDVVIPDSVKTIEAGLFDGCIALASVKLSKNTTSIPDFTFRGCTSLTSIFIPYGYKSFGIETFAGCTSLASVTFGENSYPNARETFANIGKNCFQGCIALTSIAIPSGCKQYAASVLQDTTSLSTVVLSKKSTLNSVAESMFENSSVQSLYLPSNYRNIEKNAFKNSNLKTLILGYGNVVNIKNRNAFDGVTLTDVYVPTDLVSSYQNASIWSEFGSSIFHGVEQYSVFFEPGSFGSSTMAQITELDHGSAVLPGCGFIPNTDNKVFDHWDIGGAAYAAGSIITLNGADVTATAVWKDATPATITFTPNEGTGTMASDTANVGDTFWLPECEFTREGYEFAGWVVSGETLVFDVDDSFVVQGDVTAYPLWSEIDSDTPVDPEEGGDSGESTKEEEAKKFPVAAIVILAIAGTAVVGLAGFYIVRAIVVKKIYG